MLKKMQWRFIRAAMAAFGTVMLFLAAGINLINYSVTIAAQDRMLDGIFEYEQMAKAPPPGGRPMLSEMPWAPGPEADFTTRFFAVHCDIDGNVMFISRDYIFSVDEDTIKQYASNILAKGKERGYYKEYRYRANETEKGRVVIFLNVSRDLRFITSLLLVSVVIAVISLFVVFALVVLFSGKAIKPYIRNMERQKRFITDASHELKTPLTSIATSADIIAMESGEGEWVDNIQKQTVRLSHLVASLVTLSRLDEGMPFPKKAGFSFSEAAWEAAEPFASSAKAKGKKYTEHIQENLSFHGDRSSIQQMISILLDNAVKYSGENGEIRLDIYRKHGKICIEVLNTCNLPKEIDLNRLFDRFYRPDESRAAHTGGFGIGLSIAQAVAEAHGGSITVKSRDGGTILFRVVL